MTQQSRALIAHCPEGAEVCLNERKIYWKPKAELDVVVVRHPQGCFEVAMFNSELDLESPRVYLQYSLVFERIDQAETKKRVEGRVEELIALEKEYCAEAIAKEVQDKMMMCNLLSSLTLDPVKGLAAFEGDAAGMVISKPYSLTPCTITFEKRVTVDCEGFCSALDDLHNVMQQEARKVDVYRRLFRSSMQWNHYKVAKLRWIKAINHVIVQNLLKHFRRRVAAIEKAKQRAAAGDTRPRILRRHTERLPKIQSPGSSNTESLFNVGRDRTPSVVSLPSLSRANSVRLSSGGSTPRLPLTARNSPSRPSSPASSLRVSDSVPSLAHSLRIKSSDALPKTVPAHRPYVLEKAISRACSGYFP